MTTPSYLGKRVRSSAFLTPYYLGKRQDVGTDVDPNTLYPVSEHHSYVQGYMMDALFGYDGTERVHVLAQPGFTFTLDGTNVGTDLYLFDFVLERPVVNPVMRIFLTGETSLGGDNEFQKKEDWVEIGQSTTPTVHTDTRLTFQNDPFQITIPTSFYGDDRDGYTPGSSARRIVFAVGDNNTPYLYSYTEPRVFCATAIKPFGIDWYKDGNRMQGDFIINSDASNQLFIPANTLTAEYGYFEVSTPDLKGHGTYWEYPYGDTLVGQTFPPNSVWTTIPSKPWTGVVWSSGNADVTLTQSEFVNHDGKKLYAHVKSGTSIVDWSNIVYHIKMPITIRVLPTFDLVMTPDLQSNSDADLSNCTFLRPLLPVSGYLGDFPNEPVRYTWSIHKLSDNSEVFSIEGTKTLSSGILTFDAIAAFPGTSDATHYVRCNCTLYCPSKPSIEGETRFAKYERKTPFSGVYNTVDSVDTNTANWAPKPTTVEQMCNVISSPFADNSGNEVVSFTDGTHDNTGLYSGLNFNYRNLTIYMDNNSYPNHKAGYWHHPNWAFIKGEITTGREDCYANLLGTFWAFQVILKQNVSVNEFRWNFASFSGGNPMSYAGKLFVDGVDSGYTINSSNIGGVKVSYSNSDNGNPESKKVKVELPSFITGKKFEFTFNSNQFAMRDFEFVSRL